MIYKNILIVLLILTYETYSFQSDFNLPTLSCQLSNEYWNHNDLTSLTRVMIYPGINPDTISFKIYGYNPNRSYSYNSFDFEAFYFAKNQVLIDNHYFGFLFKNLDFNLDNSIENYLNESDFLVKGNMGLWYYNLNNSFLKGISCTFNGKIINNTDKYYEDKNNSFMKEEHILDENSFFTNFTFLFSITPTHLVNFQLHNSYISNNEDIDLYSTNLGNIKNVDNSEISKLTTLKTTYLSTNNYNSYIEIGAFKRNFSSLDYLKLNEGGLILKSGGMYFKPIPINKHRFTLGTSIDIETWLTFTKHGLFTNDDILQKFKNYSNSTSIDLEFPILIELWFSEYVTLVSNLSIYSEVDYYNNLYIQERIKSFDKPDVKQFTIGVKGHIGKQFEYLFIPYIHNALTFSGLEIKYSW